MERTNKGRENKDEQTLKRGGRDKMRKRKEMEESQKLALRSRVFLLRGFWVRSRVWFRVLGLGLGVPVVGF